MMDHPNVITYNKETLSCDSSEVGHQEPGTFHVEKVEASILSVCEHGKVLLKRLCK